MQGANIQDLQMQLSCAWQRGPKVEAELEIEMKRVALAAARSETMAA